MQRAKYIGHSDYSNSLSISYSDFLQARQFEGSIRFEIREQASRQIATSKTLASQGLHELAKTRDSVERGTREVAQQLSAARDAIQTGLRDLNDSFEWGFSEILASLGRMNDSLEELVKIAKTPAQTWAFEQYVIARDEFRRHLYEEALDSVSRAINGYGSNPGNKTEYRFHFLVGTLRLGSFENSDPQLINLQIAEEAFLRAARYSEHDSSSDAALALLAAGRAAFSANHLDRAQHHAAAALSLHATPETHYQLGKIYCALGDWQSASTHLYEAIYSCKENAIRAAGDADVQAFPDKFDSLLKELRDASKALYLREREALEKQLQRLSRLSVDVYSIPKYATQTWNQLTDSLKRAEAQTSESTFLGYQLGFEMIVTADELPERCIAEFKRNSIQHVRGRMSDTQASAQQLKSKKKPIIDFGDWRFTLPVYSIGAIALISAIYEATKQQYFPMIALTFLGHALMGLVVTFVVAPVTSIVLNILLAPVYLARQAGVDQQLVSKSRTRAALEQLEKELLRIQLTDADPDRMQATSNATKPDGECPNCHAAIALDSDSCPKCEASFGAGAAWKVQPRGKA